MCWLWFFLVQRDEENRLRNRLVDWWVRVTTTGEDWIDKLSRMVQELSHMGLVILDSVFGRRILALQFGVGSVAMTHLSAVALTLFLCAIPAGTCLPFVAKWAFVTAIPLWTALFVPRLRLRLLAVYVAIWSFLIWTMGTYELAHEAVAALLFLLPALAFGGVGDAMVVPLNRLVLRSAAGGRRGLWLTPVLAVAPVLLFIALASTSLSWVATHDYPGDAFSEQCSVPRVDMWRLFKAYLVFASAYAVTFNIILGGVLLLFVCILIVNILSWKALSRFLSNAHDRVLPRELLLPVGAVLVGASQTGEPLRWLLDWMGMPK